MSDGSSVVISNSMVAGADLSDGFLRDFIKRELRSIRPTKLPDDWEDGVLFRDGLGLDSLDLVEMIARLEQLTGQFIPDEDLPGLDSVAAVTAYVQRRRKIDAEADQPVSGEA